jgi:rieske iron-sulfur protein
MTNDHRTDDRPCGCDPIRRSLLQIGAAATAAALLPGKARADDEDPGRMERPQVGDFLVYAGGDQEGALIIEGALNVGDEPVLAWAVDPMRKIQRDGSRLNQVLVVRLDPATLDAETKLHATAGFLAYSAICTHMQCSVTGWIADKQLLHCPCHQSEYDPKQDAKVVSGPAPRPLAALPLKMVDGKLQVAGEFIGKVGMNRQTM